MFEKNNIKSMILMTIAKNLSMVDNNIEVEEDGSRIILFFQKTILINTKLDKLLLKEGHLNENIFDYILKELVSKYTKLGMIIK